MSSHFAKILKKRSALWAGSILMRNENSEKPFSYFEKEVILRYKVARLRPKARAAKFFPAVVSP